MTIVSLVTIHPNPGVGWDDMQKQLKKACDIARKHGSENVTVLATMIGGAATNTIGLLSSCEDWAKFGQIQQAMMADPRHAGSHAGRRPDRHLGDVRQPDDPGYVAPTVIRATAVPPTPAVRSPGRGPWRAAVLPHHRVQISSAHG